MSPVPDPLRQLLQQAHEARHDGRTPSAQSVCAEVLRRWPEQPDALLLLAEIAQAQRDLTHAEGLLDRALRASPGHAAAWARLGSVREAQGHIAAAETALQRAVQAAPGLLAAQYNRARLLRALGRSGEATQALGQVLRPPGPAPTLRAQALHLQALLHEDAGQLAEALATLDLALRAAPNRAPLHHNRGVLLQRLARPAEALVAYDCALGLGLNVAEAHYNRGNSLQSLDRADDALAAYQAALACDPQFPLALYDIARLRWRLGDSDFTSELRAAEAAAPASAVAPGIIGKLLLHAGEHAAAADAFRRALAVEPSAGYCDGLGQALSRLGRHGEALVAHRRAVELAPQQAATHISHAAALLQAGQAQSALEAAQAATRMAPLHQQAWAMLGLAWRATADPRAGWLTDCEQFVQVYELPAPEGWPDADSFNRALAAVLETLHADTQAPVDQTLRHGSQTQGQLFEREHALLRQLQAGVADALDRYIAHLASLPHEGQHPLLSRISQRWRFTDSWSSRLRRSGFHTNHVHPHGWISSCYYVAVPPSVDRPVDPGSRAGWIAFDTPDITVPGLSRQPARMVQPRAGRLVLFPSFMWHGTLPFDDQQPRLTVAFDVVPDGPPVQPVARGATAFPDSHQG